MRQDPRSRTAHRPALALAALLLAATAAGAGSGTAHADVTGTVFELPRIAILAVDATLDDATANTVVNQVDGKPVVHAELGVVKINDTRLTSLPWSYNVAVPVDFEPVNSRSDDTPRGGQKASKSGTRFRVPDPVTGYAPATYTRADQWKRVDASGEANGLVRKTSTELNFVTGTTSFAPEMEIDLPAETPAGAYKVTVTHSVS